MKVINVVTIDINVSYETYPNDFDSVGVARALHCDGIFPNLRSVSPTDVRERNTILELHAPIGAS